MYRHSARLPILQALLAVFFFGAAAPLAKLLLGEIAAIPMAGLLYLGSGITALSLLGLSKLSRKGKNIESRLERHDLPWLAGATLAGGVIAPVILLLSLRHTPASTASMLLNFESVATTLIAILAFKKAVGQRVLRAIGLITLACIMLSWDAGGGWGLSLGALGILAACLLWGLDNNFTLPYVFDGAKLTIHAFFEIIDVKYWDDLLIRDMDTIQDLTKRPEYMEDAYSKGREMGRLLTGQGAIK